MARASVKLTGCASWEGRARKFSRRGDTKILTDTADIAFFKSNGNFIVKDLADAPKAKAKAKPAVPNPPPPSGDGKAEDGPTPWKKNSNKATLIAACESRDIAVTDEETNGSLVALLEDWEAAQE